MRKVLKYEKYNISENEFEGTLKQLKKEIEFKNDSYFLEMANYLRSLLI
jgi:hypothetical protein